MENKLNLNDDTIKALQELIEISIDSAKGLREAAEAVDHDATETLFRKMATLREEHSDELQLYVHVNGETPADEGSLIGAAHRKWLELRSAINSGRPDVVLIEAERAEGRIKSTYERLLSETAGSAMNDILMRQYSDVKTHYDLVRDLRDAAVKAA